VLDFFLPEATRTGRRHGSPWSAGRRSWAYGRGSAERQRLSDLAKDRFRHSRRCQRRSPSL